LLAVIAVNWAGYTSTAEAGPYFPPVPLASPTSAFSMVLIAAFLQAKGLTLLSFLFGYSQVLSARSQVGQAGQAEQRRAQRMQRLLVLGLLHGLLLYKGDVLTSYALCGLLMVDWGNLRWPRLRRRLWICLGLSALFTLFEFGTLLGMFLSGDGDDLLGADPGLRSASGWALWLKVNSVEFVSQQVTVTLLALPVFLFPMTAGMMAARLRLLTHPRWRSKLKLCAKFCLLPSVLISLLLACLQCAAWLSEQQLLAQVCASVNSLLAIPFVCGLMAFLSLPGTAWGWLSRCLAPAGRISLSIYLASSVVSLCVFSGLGLAWRPDTASALAFAAFAWVLALVLGHLVQARGVRLLPERWLAGT